MKKIYLASYMEKEFHGPGRKISVASSKPDDFNVDAAFKFFIPPEDMISAYKELQKTSQDSASEFFSKSYEAHLSEFFDGVKNTSQNNNTTVQDELPFEDGDTLLSWERSFRTSYRPTIARFLTDAGYEVVLK